MKVALVMPSLEVGGVERRTLSLAEGLLQKGFAVDLVIANAYGPMTEEIPNEAQLVNLKSQRVLQSIPKLIKYFQQSCPDAVVSAKDYQNIVVLLAVKLAKIKTNVIITIRIDVATGWKQSKGFKSRFIPHLARWCYPWADHIISVSKKSGDSLANVTGIPRDKIKTIYNPVVNQSLYDLANEPLEHEWFKKKNVPIILGVGRLTEQKDFETLIRAFSLVRRVRHVHLIILGEGEERPRLETLIRELNLEIDVALPGFVMNPYKYMKQTDVFVMSSRWEGLGGVLIEAMALGTPVVSTDCPSGPSEIMEDGHWGPLVPIGDHESLATAILWVLDNPIDKNKLTRRAEFFSVDRAVEAYIKLIKCRKYQP